MCFSLQGRAIFPHLKFKKWSDHGVFCTFWVANVLSQRRAIFGQLNFKKCSGNGVLLRFWLWNVLLATAACNFLTSELPKVLRDRHFFSSFAWKCASRHSGVQFFLSALSSYLRTRRFSEPTFRPSRHTNHWKNTAIRDFPNVSRGWIFFLLTFAQLYLLSSDSTSTSLLCFSSSDSTSLLCFSTLHIVGSVTSKLPLIISN